jgi:hypothetical protein
MKFATKSLGLGAVALPLALLLALPKLGAARQETPASPPAAGDLESRVVALEQIVVMQHDELVKLARVADGLVAAAAQLAVTADVAEVKGFVEAGANPDARTELLQGIRAFHDTVAKSAAPPPAPEEPAKKK